MWWYVDIRIRISTSRYIYTFLTYIRFSHISHIYVSHIYTHIVWSHVHWHVMRGHSVNHFISVKSLSKQLSRRKNCTQICESQSRQPHSRRGSDSKYLDLRITQFSLILFWVTGTPFTSKKTCLKFWRFPRKRVWYVRGLLWQLVGNFGSRNYLKSDLLRLWYTDSKFIRHVSNLRAVFSANLQKIFAFGFKTRHIQKKRTFWSAHFEDSHLEADWVVFSSRFSVYGLRCKVGSASRQSFLTARLSLSLSLSLSLISLSLSWSLSTFMYIHIWISTCVLLWVQVRWNCNWVCVRASLCACVCVPVKMCLRAVCVHKRLWCLMYGCVPEL